MSITAIEELKGERADLIKQMRDLTLEAESRGDDMTAEETEKFDKMEKDVAKLEKRFGRLEKLAGFGDSTLESRKIAGDSSSEDLGWSELDDEEKRQLSVQAKAQRAVNLDEHRERIFRGEVPAPESLKQFNELRARATGANPQDDPHYRWAFYRWLTSPDGRNGLDSAELRVLSKASAGAGLNLVPTSFARELVMALRETGVMRQISRVMTTTSGETLQIPATTAHGTAAWVAENAAFTASDETFGQASLSAYKAGTLIKVSVELLQDSAFDLESYIRQEFGTRIGILENTAYVVGDGSGKPTGVTTQASAGTTAASATTITFDNLIDLYHSLLAPYRRNAVFVLNDAVVKYVRKIKTGISGDTTYVWQPSVQVGQPDTILGKPVYTDPDMNGTMTTGLITGLFGDFSYYWIRDVNGIQFQRLNELYAENGQVGFLAYHRTDGKLQNTAAVKKLTQA